MKSIKKLRAKVYIDGANIFYAQRHMGWFVNWKKAINYLKSKAEILEINYYTGIKNDDEKMKQYLNYLRGLGIKTITKALKIIKDKSGRVIYKSNCDIEMAVDILLDADSYELSIIFSGDSDFTYLIKILQKQFQKQIWVLSSRKTISWEIKLAANSYTFLDQLEKLIKK